MIILTSITHIQILQNWALDFRLYQDISHRIFQIIGAVRNTFSEPY